MAGEVVQHADGALTAGLISNMIVEARAGLVAPPFFTQDDSIIAVPTMASKISKDPTTANAGAITDGTAMANTGFTPTSVTVTASGVGLKTVLTGFAQVGSNISAQRVIANFARALINKMDVDGCGLIDDFSTTVGTTTADLTIAQMLLAIFELEDNSEASNLLFLLHPVQVHDVRAAIVASAAPVWTAAGPAATLMNNAGAGAFKGSFLGIPVYSSPNVVTANAGADRAGALFSANRALRQTWKWLPTIETIASPEFGAKSMTLALSACYGVGEDVDGAGCSIITDA